ncbi:complement receptor type 2-like [Bolinopsis microptera]|uniref:complement receptor type 2-like n=1 Tax=Bolinopsis microptera TaxID=2820187 RepID=UPI003079A455
MPCPKPGSRIPNGRVLNTGNNIQPGARLHIQCDPDYTISYEQHVTCVTSDIFHPSLPSCNDRECSIPYIRNGRITSPATSGSVSPDTTISISCDIGYDLVGRKRIQCIRANTFSPDLSTVSCRARPCLLASAPRHGTFTTSQAEPGDVISLSCDPNYQLSFSDSVYCVTDNQYRVRGESGGLPTCIPLPCPAPELENGAALGPVTPGDPLTVSCNTGYVISSQQSVTCVAGQIFSPQLPRCQAQPCPVPRTILHSLPSTVSHVQPGDLLQITCDPNYQLTSHSVTCVTLSRFSNSLPTCRATNCRLPSVPHGQWSDSTLTPGQSGQLECTSGYTGTGTSQLVRCISGNKLYPGTLDAACVENCQVDAQIASNRYLEPETSEPVRPGDKVRVRCNPGFEHVVRSEEVLTCVTGTIFQPTAVRGCRAVPCRVPHGPQHGRYTTSRTTLQPGDELTVTCEAGYHVTGPRAVTCVTAETFSGDIPACRPGPCPVPTIINGTALHSSPVLQPDQKLEYRCLEDISQNKLSVQIFIFLPTTIAYNNGRFRGILGQIVAYHIFLWIFKPEMLAAHSLFYY